MIKIIIFLSFVVHNTSKNSKTTLKMLCFVFNTFNFLKGLFWNSYDKFELSLLEEKKSSSPKKFLAFHGKVRF